MANSTIDGSRASQSNGDNLKSGSNQGPITLPRCYLRLQNGLSAPSFSISYKLFCPFHGGNTGSNPVGDAKILKELPDFRFCAPRRDHRLPTC